MKKILFVIILFLSTGCAPLGKNLDEKFEIAQGYKVTYCNGEYYFYKNNTLISVTEDNIETERVDCSIIKENERLYIENKNNEKILVGKLENNHYEEEYDFSEKEFVNVKVLYNDVAIVTVKLTNEEYYSSHNYYFFFDGYNHYLLTLKYNNGAYTDMSIGGQDYINSKLYRINVKDNDFDLIYSTDNTKAIIYGNDETIFYADKNYDIYKQELNSNKVELVYDTPRKDGIVVDYTHNKLFIFDNDDNVGLLDIKYSN